MAADDAERPAFRIDDPEIDTVALEERVRAAIEAKRGVRFTDEELEELRATRLEPRLRREDLPSGLPQDMTRVRRRLPEIDAAPGSAAARPPGVRRPEVERPAASTQPAEPVQIAFEPTGGSRAKRFLRRMAQRLLTPFFDQMNRGLADAQKWADDRSGERFEQGFDALNEGLERTFDSLNERLERSFDSLKDLADRRIDATADWAGEHLSEMTGQLDRRHERELHLQHNLVYELTDARLLVEQLQDRLNDLARRFDELAARERALEELTLGARSSSEE